MLPTEEDVAVVPVFASDVRVLVSVEFVCEGVLPVEENAAPVVPMFALGVRVPVPVEFVFLYCEGWRSEDL